MLQIPDRIEQLLDEWDEPQTDSDQFTEMPDEIDEFVETIKKMGEDCAARGCMIV